MKQIILRTALPFTLIFTLLSLLSCSPFSRPERGERELLNQEFQPEKISMLIDDLLEQDKALTVLGSHEGPEALEFLSYIIPILHDRQSLSMKLWFLSRCTDNEILSYLRGEEGALTTEELLLKSDPARSGFTAYADFLEKLKGFYAELEDPSSLLISNTAEVFLDFRLYGTEIPSGERAVYLINAPLNTGRRWELPFRGLLYSMMIHEWPLREYGYLSIKDSSLASSYLTPTDSREKRSAGDLVDGILLLSFPRTYTPMERIEGFITEENVSSVLAFFPRQLIREKTKPAAYLVNLKINMAHRRAVRRLRRIYETIGAEIPGSSQD